MEKWVLFLTEKLKWHCWDDAGVVFNPATGETHQVGLLAIELLSSLDFLRSSTSADLLSGLSDVFVDFDPDESMQMIEDALSQLELFRLIKRASS